MKKIHPATSLAVIFLIAGLVCYFLGYHLAAAIFPVLAFFATVSEVSKYTSIYQFIVLTCSCLVLGIICENNLDRFPFTLISMLAVAVTCITRISFFRVFSYTSYSWFEPLMVCIALILYLCGPLINHTGWQAWVFPAPLLAFAIYFAWGIVKDKNQLLYAARGGYKVKIGHAADDFNLPDQDGELTRLSEYKNTRHVLLIFVRGDWCPGCHMMLRTYQKNSDKFRGKNILVMAIGPDPVGVNRDMVEKLGLDFKVLSDTGQRTAMVYGVQLKEYDNPVATSYKEGIPLPASFLIDKKGIVQYVSRPDKVGEFLNPALILPVVDKLES